MLGGNEPVTNILLFSSTNIIMKIDNAFIRRTLVLYVGLPGKEERKMIIQSKGQRALPYINDLIKITPNFSGSALGKLIESIENSLILKRKKK